MSKHELLKYIYQMQSRTRSIGNSNHLNAEIIDVQSKINQLSVNLKRSFAESNSKAEANTTLDEPDSYNFQLLKCK